MVYEWNVKGIFKTDANTAGAVCEELSSTVGLTKKSLVDASRAKDAPLHGEFEWNNRIAAEKYREEQAGKIIRSLVIRTEQTNQEPIRAYFTLDAHINKGGTYEHIQTIMATPEKTTSLLELAMNEMKAFQTKYSTLSELAKVFQAMDEVIGEDT